MGDMRIAVAAATRRRAFYYRSSFHRPFFRPASVSPFAARLQPSFFRLASAAFGQLSAFRFRRCSASPRLGPQQLAGRDVIFDDEDVCEYHDNA